MDKNKIIEIMKKEMVVALGCTDPISISYAAAVARKYAPTGEIKRITTIASVSIIRNATSVIIPGTDKCGVAITAALGALFGNAERKLEVLEGITAGNVAAADKFVKAGKSTVSVAQNDKKLYVEVIMETENHKARVVIADDYANVVFIEKDGEILLNKSHAAAAVKNENITGFFNIDTIWEFINEADPASDLEHIQKSIELNVKAGKEGLLNDYGLKVGKTIREQFGKGLLKSDIPSLAMSFTAAGVDARMDGAPIPVMSNSGSGNQGITATLPVVVFAENLDADKDKKIRAVALSNLIAIYIKSYLGKISALCGAMAAATGAGCGIVYLLGGGKKEVEYAVQNMMGDVTGMLCDGAKAGCALKVSTCLQAAIQAALLAINHINIKDTDGIIGKNVEETLTNLGRLSEQGLGQSETVILDIMVNKSRAS